MYPCKRKVQEQRIIALKIFSITTVTYPRILCMCLYISSVLAWAKVEAQHYWTESILLCNREEIVNRKSIKADLLCNYEEIVNESDYYGLTRFAFC
jgi:hypothetical protein